MSSSATDVHSKPSVVLVILLIISFHRVNLQLKTHLIVVQFSISVKFSVMRLAAHQCNI